jgi:hypothetical protein
LRRPVALLLAAVLALVLAGSSSTAALTSAKFVASGASQSLRRGGVKMKYQQRQSDDPVAKIVFYVPKGYQVLTGRSTRTPIGAVAATIFAGDLNAVVPATGTVEIAMAADLEAQSASCTGTTTHDEFWVLRLAPSGRPLVIPAYLDRITTGPLERFSSAQIVICLEPGDLPPDTQGRAPLGAKVLLAEFTSSSIVNPSAAGDYRWRAVVTPYTPGTGKTNAEGAVELQSVVSLASTVSLRAVARRTARAGVQMITYRGRLLSNLRGVGEAVVEVFRGPTAGKVKKFKSQAPNSSGVFTGSFTVKQGSRPTSLFLLAKATVGEQDLEATDCVATFEAIPCGNMTVGGFTVSSKLVRVSVAAAKKR